MNKYLTIALTTVLFFNLTTHAQTVYELDQVKQLPTIDKKNMNIIASSVQQLFDNAIKEPLKYSTAEATNETVYAFYDSDDDGKLHKINPQNGKQYSISDSSDLRKNQFSTYGKKEPQISLHFNLTFDVNGKLLVPEKIYVISFRTEDNKKTRAIQQIGLLAFELTLPDSIKAELSQVKLQNLAKKDVNSLTGGLSPVSIKLPFELKYGSNVSNVTSGKATKRGDAIDISIGRYFDGNEEKEHLISLLKEKSDILSYKKGEFNFTIETSYFGCFTGFNIVADNIIANRKSKTSSQGFSIKKETVISFSGEGKKIKK